MCGNDNQCRQKSVRFSVGYGTLYLLYGTWHYGRTSVVFFHTPMANSDMQPHTAVTSQEHSSDATTILQSDSSKIALIQRRNKATEVKLLGVPLFLRLAPKCVDTVEDALQAANATITILSSRHSHGSCCLLHRGVTVQPWR